jgi:EmrB/QacA subfamily drug resistance transporter
MVKRVIHKNLILLILATAQFMVVLDTSVVNVALPSIYRGLHFHSDASLQWIITAYTLAFGGFLLLGGRAADLYGRKRMFLAGLGLFTVMSLLSGLAQNTAMIEISRAIQGLAAAFMSPAALSIVLTTFKEGKERNKALSIWGAVAAGGAAAGVLLGGILTQYLGWRWNFFVNVPVGAVLALTTLWYIPESSADLDHRQLDLPGAVTVTGGLILLVYGLTKAPSYGWSSHKTLELLLPSLLLLVVFVLNESRSKHPLMPLSVFKIRNVSAANLTQLPILASLFSMFFFITLYVQIILGYSPVKSGLGFLPVTFIIGAIASGMSVVVNKIGFKKPLVIAPLFMAVGLYMLTHVRVGGNYWNNVFPGLAVMSVGLGMVFVAMTIAATNGVPHKLSGLASGLLNTSQQIGGALGLAVLSGIAASTTASYLIHHPKTPLLAAQAQVAGFHKAFQIGIFFALLAFVLALVLIRDQKIESDAVPIAQL